MNIGKFRAYLHPRPNVCLQLLNVRSDILLHLCLQGYRFLRELRRLKVQRVSQGDHRGIALGRCSLQGFMRVRAGLSLAASLLALYFKALYFLTGRRKRSSAVDRVRLGPVRINKTG